MDRKRKKKVIGLLIEELESEFSKDLIQSIVSAIPSSRDIQLVVFAGKYINNSSYDKTRTYKTVYNSVYKLGGMCGIDGIIMHFGSMGDEQIRGMIMQYADNYINVPKVFIALNSSEHTTVNYDNERGIREAVNCLVNVNGLTRFCMLGGRDDNIDARARKDIFIRCLKENDISFSRWNYEKTDMSENCITEAARLLDNNIGVQAIFCVNDSVARGLYEAMKARDLVPGKDVYVFGFDNTHMAGEMTPTLSSIGADKCSLGKMALEVMLAKLNGTDIGSALVPTRLYGRQSFYYEMYDYTAVDLQNADEAFIYRLFDDCFYRYRNETMDRESVNLKRLFYEFMSRMFKAMKKRYTSYEDYSETAVLIEKFFEKGAMEYTDAAKLITSIDRVQFSMNNCQRSPASRIMTNRLFALMRDKAMCALAEKKSMERESILEKRSMTQDFMIAGMTAKGTKSEKEEQIFRNITKLGIRNAAVYMYDSPVQYSFHKVEGFPENIKLRCVVRSGEMYLIPKERQFCRINDIFVRDELSSRCKGYAPFIIFYDDKIYGIILCELTSDIYDRGEYIALQLGRTIYIINQNN